MLLGWLEPFLQDVLVQVLQCQTVRCCSDSLLQLVDEYVLLLNISCSHPVQTVHTYSTQQPQSVQTGKSLTGNAAGMLLLILVLMGVTECFSVSVATVVMAPQLGDVPGRITCPHCHQSVVTIVNYKTGLLTWLICGTLGVFLWVSINSIYTEIKYVSSNTARMHQESLHEELPIDKGHQKRITGAEFNEIPVIS